VARDLSREGISRASPVLTRVLALAVGLVGGFWAVEEVLEGRSWQPVVAAILFLPLHALLRRRVGAVWLPVALAIAVGLTVLVIRIVMTGQGVGDGS
jgi:O-antigen ligase